MEKFFKLGLRGTDKKTEIIAGLTTQLSLLVILVLVLLITQPPGEFYPTATPPQGSDAAGTLTDNCLAVRKA